MGKKSWSWQRKLATFIGIVVLVWAARFGIQIYQGIKSWRSASIPTVYTFSNASELDTEEKRFIEARLPTHIPESASDIYFFKSGGMPDVDYFYSFSLPAEEIPKFAEEFAGVPISEFKDGKNYEDELFAKDFAVKGPALFGEKWKTPLWNLENVKRSKYYELFDRGSLPTPLSGRFIVIDLETNRVHLCIWNT